MVASNSGQPSRARRLARAFVILVPALLLAQLLWVAIDIMRLNAIDSEQLLRVFSDHVAQRDAEPLPSLGRTDMGSIESGATIWVLGASSIFFPRGETFVEQLAGRLRARNPSLQVTNLGISGIESRALVEQFEASLSQSPRGPELLIIYAGHNDYNVLYHASLARSFDLFEPLFHLLAPFTQPGLRHGMTVYLRTRVPPLLEWLQRGRLLDFSHLDLTVVNQRIEARFRRNLERIIDRCEALETEVLLVTPVGNLLARPYGSRAATTAPYMWGLALPDSAARIALLQSAQESEFVTYDIRAKAGIAEAMRSLAGSRVSVVDLDSWLVVRGLRLHVRLFADYFHFTKWGHARVTECLWEALAARPKLWSRLGLGPTATAESLR